MFLSTGTFDPPHMAHARLLARARKYTDSMVVGVLSDEFVLQYKGTAPQWSEHERLAQISMFGFDLFPHFAAKICTDQAGFITTYRPEVIVVGSDWHTRDYLAQLGITQNELDRLGIGILYLSYTPGMTSTDIKRRANGHTR